MSEFNHSNLPKNDGDVRRLILEQIVGIGDGSVSVQEGLAKAALFKELNASMNTSIQAAKMSLQMEATGRKFVNTLHLGNQEISGEPDEQKQQ